VTHEDTISGAKPAVALLTLLGAALRLFRLDRQSVWLDEGYQYHFASAPTAREVLARVLDPAQSTHPPLSHLINHAFLQLGDSDFILRLPSALFGIASIPLLYLLARRLAGARAALFATVSLHSHRFTCGSAKKHACTRSSCSSCC
jgi:4-amino-4-deoxy-L-arabinose transferase-like glycosyltransferase